MQTTLKREITLVGMGLHSGRPARMVLRPATEGGIRFRRVDVRDRDNVIPARFDLVSRHHALHAADATRPASRSAPSST